MDITTTEVPEHKTKKWWALALSAIFHTLLIPNSMFLLLMVVNYFLFGANDFGEERALFTLMMMVLYTAVITRMSVLCMV